MKRLKIVEDVALSQRCENEYVELFKVHRLQEQWARLCGDNVNLQPLSQFSVKDILTAKFENLVEIAAVWNGIMAALGNQSNKQVKTDTEKIFNYNYFYRKSIRDFFIRHADELNLYTCYYCELSYINVFEGDNGGRKFVQFDIDHVLPKSDYPLFALSLYNMVPACPVCNERLKKDKLPGSLDRIKKLSPSSPDFRFNEDVKFRIKPKRGGGGLPIPYMANAEAYRIGFDCEDPDYNDYIAFFKLDERYNYHRCEALRIKDLKLKYNEVHVKELADLLKCDSATLKEDIFGVGFRKDHHRCMEKLYRDIFEE